MCQFDGNYVFVAQENYSSRIQNLFTASLLAKGFWFTPLLDP
jgi:hypothetical protein